MFEQMVREAIAKAKTLEEREKVFADLDYIVKIHNGGTPEGMISRPEKKEKKK